MYLISVVFLTVIANFHPSHQVAYAIPNNDENCIISNMEFGDEADIAFFTLGLGHDLRILSADSDANKARPCKVANFKYGNNATISHFTFDIDGEVGSPRPDKTNSDKPSTPTNVVNVKTGDNVEISHLIFNYIGVDSAVKGDKGARGLKGVKGEQGPMGKCECNIDEAEIKRDILGSIGAASCQDLIENQGVKVSGYYLIRGVESMSMKFMYCDFEKYQTYNGK